MNLMQKCLAAGAAFMLLSTAVIGQDEPAVLIVHVEGIETFDGDIRVDLFDSPDSFMSEPFRTISTPPGDRSDYRVRFDELPPGEYAVSVLQDLNGSGELERGLLGRASEPIAFSNGARFGFGPPFFDEAAVAVSPGLNEIIIRF